MKIGICDYGIGGIGLYKAIRAHSTVDIVYFSDAGYTPYGKVPEAELKDRMEKVIEYFHSLGVTYIAVACNAASTVIPKNNTITGIIEHGVNMVLKINPSEIAVVGGARTLDSQLYKKAFEENGTQTTQRVAQQLSIRIEAGDINSSGLDEDIQAIFEPIKNSGHILLACTHYPVIADRIRRVALNAKLIDPVQEMSQWIFANWPKLEGHSTVKWTTSGDVEQMKFASKYSFDVDINEIEKVTL